MATMIPDQTDMNENVQENSDQESSEKPEIDKDNINRIAKSIIDQSTISDKTGREALVLLWKRNLLYWSGFQKLFQSSSSPDWRTPFDLSEGERDEFGIDIDEVSRILNKYRGHGEVFVSALSAGLPHTRFYPDDADNPDDLTTSDAYSRIAELIEKHNDSFSLFVYALFTIYNQSFVAAHTYYETSHEYGTEKIPQYEMQEQENTDVSCSSCGEYVDVSSLNYDQENYSEKDKQGKSFSIDQILEEEGLSEFTGRDDLDGSDEKSQDGVSSFQGSSDEQLQSTSQGVDKAAGLQNSKQVNCPTCGPQDAYEEKHKDFIPVITGFIDNPKGRTRIDVHGSLEVKLPINIRKLSEAAYLILENEQSAALMQEMYPDQQIMTSSDNTYEKWGREPNLPVINDPNSSMVTVSQCWIRPWAYNILGFQNPDIAVMKEEYPNGFCAVVINDKVVECRSENLDDHWTISESPLSRHIHADPVGNPFIPVQDMINDLVHLTMETIEHEIPLVFADPRVLDFNQFAKSSASPGQIFPAKAASGKNMDQSFYSIKPSTLSQYVQIFQNQLDRDGEFVLGTQASVYGGQIQGSDTLGEYEIRRNQALQRLSIFWKMINSWWAQVMAKSVRLFANNMQSDESFVRETEGSFLNVFIKRAELNGKVGRVEPETSDQFPVSHQQKRGVVFELMNSKQPQVEAALFHPENVTFMKNIIGLPEFYIPGHLERMKELRVISDLLKAQPVSNPMSPVGMSSSIPIEPDLDDDAICIATCKHFLISEMGLSAKTDNTGGYQNIMLHMKEHQMNQMMTAQQGMSSDPNAQPQEGQGSEISTPPNGAIEAPPSPDNMSGQV